MSRCLRRPGEAR
ncbi:hypothetical protein LINGRAHAP2_LOCUS25349 [Linum grandiflorum]